MEEKADSKNEYIDGKIKIFNRHSSYEDYVKKQIEKTLDLKRISMWKGAAWQIKVDGFSNVKYLIIRKYLIMIIEN